MRKFSESGREILQKNVNDSISQRDFMNNHFTVHYIDAEEILMDF